MPECRCPYCGKKLDRCSSVQDRATPKPGDLTLCFGCSLLMAFDAELRVRPLNAQELERLLGDPELQEIVARTGAAIRHMKSITSPN